MNAPAFGDRRVQSVNVGAIREIEWRGHLVRTGIWKVPVGDRPAA